jgi:YfiH family protein
LSNDGTRRLHFAAEMPSSALVSPLLPIPHGFTTRHGGVSGGAFASLNVSGSVGDAPENVAENLRRIAAGAGIFEKRLAAVTQVHGREVVRAGEGEPPQADALWTEEVGLAVSVKTADCVPILLVDPEGRRVAAVHSGWRGTDLEVAAAAVEALASLGARPEKLLAAVGPCIQSCCYEVSADLAKRFAERFGAEVVSSEGGAPHLDLPRAVRATLQRAGVRGDRIDILARCTSCEPEDFFSHRRDRGRTGRHLNFAVCAF